MGRMSSAALYCSLTFLVCACTGTSNSNDTPPPNTPTPSGSLTTTKRATPGLPSVDNPLDLSDYRASPCDLLNDAELAPLQLGEGAQGRESSAGDCFYTGELSNRNLLVRLYPKESRLADAYQLDKDDYRMFEPVEIQGFPAVKEARPKDKSEDTTCRVVIGVADDQSVVLYYNPKREVEPGDAEATCAKVVTVAEVVLKRLGA